jgi:butyrate kinase
MVSKEKLKEVLRKEKVKAIYDSIDTKELNRLEQESVEYDEYNKKEYHPMSYQIAKEHKEWWEKHPLRMDLINIEMIQLGLTFAYLGMWFMIGFVVVCYAIFSF